MLSLLDHLLITYGECFNRPVENPQDKTEKELRQLIRKIVEQINKRYKEALQIRKREAQQEVQRQEQRRLDQQRREKEAEKQKRQQEREAQREQEAEERREQKAAHEAQREAKQAEERVRLEEEARKYREEQARAQKIEQVKRDIRQVAIAVQKALILRTIHDDPRTVNPAWQEAVEQLQLLIAGLQELLAESTANSAADEVFLGHIEQLHRALGLLIDHLHGWRGRIPMSEREAFGAIIIALREKITGYCIQILDK